MDAQRKEMLLPTLDRNRCAPTSNERVKVIASGWTQAYVTTGAAPILRHRRVGPRLAGRLRKCGNRCAHREIGTWLEP